MSNSPKMLELILEKATADEVNHRAFIVVHQYGVYQCKLDLNA
jgi:hypothetical protein